MNKYRGYDIEFKNNNYYISKQNYFVCQQPSLEFAKKWIDSQLNIKNG